MSMIISRHIGQKVPDLLVLRCGRYPPEVRTAIPVDGRFEHIVLSCNATSDHGIIWIQREAEKALQIMESKTITTAPKIQKIGRLQTIQKEHRDALERAVSLNIPHAAVNSDDELDLSACDDIDDPSRREEHAIEDEFSSNNDNQSSLNEKKENHTETKPESTEGKTNWNDVEQKLFKKNETGSLVYDRNTVK